ncbi:MAG: phosphoglycolate phosphatase [marine bacterium B5-7]|nr:MAG: phosphoglycolate phosphatase [marine bacterium B5-7]
MIDAASVSGIRPQAVLFDLDGTLVDTALDLTAALNHVLTSIDLKPLADEAVRAYVSAGAGALLALGLNTRIDDSHVAELRAEFLDYYGRNLAVHSCLFEGMDDLLEELAEAQIPWGIVTNKPRAYTLPLIDLLALRHQPACVICGDDFAVKKPHPAPLTKAFRLLDTLPFHGMYVGDDRRDIIAGWRVGCSTVVAGWGYLGPGESILTWGAHAICETPVALSRLIFEQGINPGS